MIEDALDLPYGDLERTKRKIEVKESIEQLVTEIKVDLLGGDLLERDMKIVACVTRAVADELERMSELYE